MRELVSMLVASAVVGCADGGDRQAQPCDGEDCRRACDAVVPGMCDVFEASCRQRVLDALICVRGTPAVLPDVRTISEDEYRAELFASSSPDAGVLDAAADEDAGQTDDSGADAGSVVPSVDAWSTGLGLLGLLAPQSELTTARREDSVKNTAGFYNSVDRRITLIDHGDEDGGSSIGLFAHELTHALQDQDAGLFELFERTAGLTDAQLARSCIVEGEANLYAQLALGLLLGESIDFAVWDLRLRRVLKDARRAAVTAESPYLRARTLTYAVGERYLLDAWLDGGNTAVRSIWAGMPTSTLQWIHGYRARVEQREPLLRALACNDAAAPPGFELSATDTMGPLVVFAFLGATLRDGALYESEQRWRDAAHWRQDNLSLFTHPDGAVAVSWRIRFDEPGLAGELADALEVARATELKLRRTESEFELLASDDPAVLEAWAGTDPEACPEACCDGDGGAGSGAR